MSSSTLLIRPTLADSHVHLDDAAFDPDRDEVIARAADAGESMLVLPAIDAASWPRIKALCASHANIFPAYGLHPMYLAQHTHDHLRRLGPWLEGDDAVAVGEIGLDFHDPALDPQMQRVYFHEQLALARDHDLPVIMHARGALEEVIQTLRRWPGLRGVVHSFSGSEQQALQLFGMGFHIGIGGPVTYDRAQRLRRIVRDMPLDHLLLESDAPDQPNTSHRGERNEPERITEVMHCIATLRDVPDADVAAVTTANTRRLFRLDDPRRHTTAA